MGSLTWLPVGVIGILSWSVGFIRRYLSHHHYRETVNDFQCTTSLVVPVDREDPEVLQRCPTTWLAQAPDEVILVVDDRDDLLLKFLGDLDLPTVRIVPWRHTGKRGALGVGVRLAVGDLIVFADSDTNTFDGAEIRGGADSWVNVRGNGWLIEGNIGTTVSGSGFEVHQILDGWGTGNEFDRNTAGVRGAGYGFEFRPVADNRVTCANTVENAARGG